MGNKRKKVADSGSNKRFIDRPKVAGTELRDFEIKLIPTSTGKSYVCETKFHKVHMNRDGALICAKVARGL